MRLSWIRSLLRLALDLPQTSQRRLTLLKFVEVVGDVGDGIDQHDQPRQVAAQPGDTQITALDSPGSEGQHGKQTHHLDDAHHRMLERHKAVGAVAGLPVLIDFRLETVLQPGLGGKSTHQGQTFDGLTQQTGQFAHLFLTSFRGRHHASTKQADQPDDHRRQQQDGQRQFPVEPEHHPQHRNELKHAGDRVVNGLVQHLADAIGVFGEAVGEITGRELLQCPQLHGLQAAEQITP